MTPLTSDVVVRPGPGGLKGWLTRYAIALIPFGFAVLRRFRPILRLGRVFVVTLHDDVREAFGTDAAFGVVYADKLKGITERASFFVEAPDSPDAERQLAAV